MTLLKAMPLRIWNTFREVYILVQRLPKRDLSQFCSFATDIHGSIRDGEIKDNKLMLVI